jgi:hypothetical protein
MNMSTTNEQNDGASKARRVHIETETPASTDDLWSTAGKNGRPPLPAQPDPAFPLPQSTAKPVRKPGRPRNPHPIDGQPTGDPQDPPLTAGQIAKMEADTAAERSRTRKPAANSEALLTAIVYATKDRSECGGHVIDRQGGPDGKADLVVNNGMALISIPASEEGTTWLYLHIAEERRRQNLPIKLSPATIRSLPASCGAAGHFGTETADPAPCPPPAINPIPLPDDLLWLALESFAGDIETEIVARNPETVRHAASLILRLLRIAGV